MAVGKEKPWMLMLTVAARSDDFEIALQFPVGDAVLPLAPFPFAGRGEVIDEIGGQPVPGDRGIAKDSRGRNQAARGARNFFGAFIRAPNRGRGKLQALLD